MNSYHRVLPNTGLAVSIFGVTVGGAYLVLVACLLVALGAVMIRVGWRRDHAVADR